MSLDDARAVLTNATRITSFSGAGLSAESGIATFRDTPDSHWSRYDPTRLASPEGFADDPDLVLNWYGDRRRDIAAASPNDAHRALANCPAVTHVTQNVDDLLERAGASDVIHLHGTIGADRCHAECGFRETIDMADPPHRRPCPTCGAPMRPAVVWFGEMLPADAWEAALSTIEHCDVLLVIGTSAVVYPAAGLIDVARQGGARVVVVNPEASGATGDADIEIRATAGEAVPILLADLTQ
ncbi:MAG: NAD-dependent deacylase [Planctomycetota bacterium]